MRKIELKSLLDSQQINTLAQFLKRRDIIWGDKVYKVTKVVEEQMRTINGDYVPYQVEKGVWVTNIRTLQEIQVILEEFLKVRKCPAYTTNIVKIEKILRDFISSYK